MELNVHLNASDGDGDPLSDLTRYHHLVEFGVSVTTPTTLLSNSTSAISVARDLVKHELTKHIDVDASFVRAGVQDLVIALHMQSDISRLEAKIERMDAQLAAKDRELATLTRTEAKNTAALKAHIEKLQQERDEFQKMVIGNQQVRSQQIHETKKKEKEYIKLQEKLNQVLMEKKKESSRSGMEIMNLLQKEGRQRGTWTGKKNDNDYYKMIVDAYEVKKQELVQENADLRALLRSMQMDMREFLNAPTGSSQPAVAGNGRQEAGSPQSPLGGKTARMTQLQDAQKGAEVTSEVTERELELEAQLVEARSIIQEQASIMSKHFSKSDKPRRLSGLDAEREAIHSASTDV
ncbi:unnamed protein product [Triticum turgidum subsp. durum]|uniref:Uncharacterized protein n=1 Tax=Triticum turgidum subsp. durum TaxID=4567 RepID=A0A9R1BZV3_TRITD|nr:unnamed protein product [Triticum turgidum subsp. durum]